MDPKEIAINVMSCTNLAWDRDYWRALKNAAPGFINHAVTSGLNKHPLS